MKESAKAPRRILVFGNVEGQFQTLSHVINRLVEKSPNTFDCVFLVGRTFANIPSENAELTPFVKKQSTFPVPIYFTDSSELAGPFMTAYPDGFQVCQNFHFLGRSGVKIIKGLRIAFLSGVEQNFLHYDFQKAQLGGDQESELYSDNMYTYSDVDKILNEERSVDLFLTGEWPSSFKSVFLDQPSHSHSSNKGKLNSLLSSLSARYIFCSHDDRSYKREPFATEAGFVCRFVGLKSCSKHNVNNYLRQLFMGLSLLPITQSSEAELKQNIHQAAPNPFRAYKSRVIEASEKGEDKSTLFISNLPLEIRENQLVEFLLRWGPLSTIEYRRSYAFVKFKDQEVHQKLIKQSGKHSLHGRSVGIAYKTIKEDQRIISTDSCWFCYDNPQIQRHLIVQKGAKHFYVACAKGPLTDYHLLLIPKVHISSSFEFEEEAKQEYLSMKRAILQFYGSKELDFLAFQVYLPRKDRSHTSHTFLSLIGFERVTNFDDLFLEFLYSKKMKSKDPASLTEQEVENFTKYGFFMCQFPGMRTASGQKTIERIHGASKGMPPDIGRRLLVDFLELPRQRMNWKKCTQTEEVEKAETQRLAKEMKDFLIQKK